MLTSNQLSQICSCTWVEGLREPGIDCPVHPRPAGSKERFRKVESNIPWRLVPCRLCGSPAELWQRWRRDDVWDSFGACTNLEDVDGEACLFHLPDDPHFYRDRKTDAVRHWNLMMGPRTGDSSAHETSRELERLRELQEKALALDDAVAEFGIDKPQYIAEVYQAFHDALHDGHGCPSVVETAAPETTAPRCDWHDRELECAVCCGYVDGLDRGTCGPNAKVYVGSSQETKPKPTIEGLERLLQAEDSKQVYVWPDGYVHDTPPPEKAPEAHIDYNVPGCDCLGCELAPKTLVEVRAFGTSIDPPSQKALAPRYELPLEWQAREWTEIDSPSSLCGLLGCNRQTPHHHKAAL